MTELEFERQNGLTPEVLWDGIRFWARVVLTGTDIPQKYNGTTLVADATKSAKALDRLAEKVYRAFSVIATEAQGFRCGRENPQSPAEHGCRKRVPLQAHHIIHRSQGRNDRPSNLVMKCVGCHAREHGEKVAC